MGTGGKVAAAAAAALVFASASGHHGHGLGLSAFTWTQGHSHNAAVRYAEAQLGKPYAWGGTGPWSFDCSGLAMRAEQAAGISIPRTSQEQWAQLRHVRHPRPGDLVFFVGSGDGGTWSAPGHVGIVVGHGQMIDAPQPGMDVRQESYLGWSGLVGFTDPGA